jgi:hypothetical protein
LIGQRQPAVKPGGVAKALPKHAASVGSSAKSVAAVARGMRRDVQQQAMRNIVAQWQSVQLVAGREFWRRSSSLDDAREVPGHGDEG